MVRPVTVIGLPDPVADWPPLAGLVESAAVTVYPEMAEPLESAAVKVTVAWVSPALVDTSVGAPGRPLGVTGLEAAEAIPVPFPLVAVTVKV